MKRTDCTHVESHNMITKRWTRQMSWAIPVLLMLVGLGVTPVFAQDHGSHADGTHKEETKTPELPKTLLGLLISIRDHQHELHEAVEANELEEVHHIAFTVRDLVAALPDKSKLSGEQKKVLKKSVTRVDSLATQLDEAGDAGDSTAVALLVGRFDMEIQGVEALYAPKDVMPAATATAASKPMYVCPMHPEITSDKASECSKCGMDLVKKNH